MTPAPGLLGRAALAGVARRGTPVVPTGGRPGRTGVVHLGAGAFARGHVLELTARAVDAEPGHWAVSAVAQRSEHVVGALAAQDGLYAVLVRDGGQRAASVVDVVAECLVAARQPDAVRARLADPATRVVTVTATEAAYRTPAGGAPSPVVGQLADAARDRMRAGAGPLTVVACDNVAGGGRLLRDLVLDRLGVGDGVRDEGDALRAWVEEHVGFCSSVVDRIVPAVAPGDLDEVEAVLGVRDEAAVVTEPFARWVLEDAARTPLPAWERAGALRVADVRPWELAKLRLLNAPHSALAYLGLAAGLSTTAEAVACEPVAAAVRELLVAELAPTVPDAPGLEVAAEVERSLARCANPGLAHPLAQIAAGGSAKLAERLAGPALEHVRAGRVPTWTALVVAAWVLHLRQGGQVADPLAERLVPAASGEPGAAVRAVLGEAGVFDPELAASPAFVDATTTWLRRLLADDVRTALRRP